MSSQPGVQYATTRDGVSVAWSEMGRGKDLLYCGSTPLTHVQEQFAINPVFFEALAHSFRLITFDARGSGMSEREVTDISSATLIMDAEAVVEAAKLDQCVAFAEMDLLAAWTALQLAAEHPERVTHVVLESPFLNMRELADTPLGRVGPALAETDWNIYLQTVFRVLGGWDTAETAWVEPVARAAAGWVEQSIGLQYMRLREEIDIGDLLSQVRQPTLVTRLDPNYVPARCSQRVTARVPGAQLRQYTDTTGAEQVELVRLFVGQPATPSTDAERLASGMAVILFTDIVSSTELTERLGDSRFREAWRSLEAGLRSAIAEAGGAAIDLSLGDGVLATFPSASQAIDGAGRCLALSAASELGLHIGLHAGDVIREENNVFGGAVNIASRICGLSTPGEILVSDVVRGMARTSADVTFEDRGEHALKGVADPQRVYAVRANSNG